MTKKYIGNNLYLFIIWNKALFAREKIISDLSKDFVIRLDAMVTWNKKEFSNDLESFYGSKISDSKSKILYIGNGPFNVLVVEDRNPVFDYRKTYDGDVLVNSKVFDKKDMYREWTGRDFRIHNSITPEETKHDLIVLFGQQYLDLLDNNIKSFVQDTKGVEGFKTIEELMCCLNSFGNNYLKIIDNELTIICRCRLDIVRFIKCNRINDNQYELQIDNNKYNISIYGEAEGDLPKNTINNFDETSVNDFIKIKNTYDQYLKDRILNIEVKLFFEKYKLDSNFIKKDSLRVGQKTSTISFIKKMIRYYIARIKY